MVITFTLTTLFTMYFRLLIQIEEGLHRRGMGARQGRPFCQAAEALEIPVTRTAVAT